MVAIRNSSRCLLRRRAKIASGARQREWSSNTRRQSAATAAASSGRNSRMCGAVTMVPPPASGSPGRHKDSRVQEAELLSAPFGFSGRSHSSGGSRLQALLSEQLDQPRPGLGRRGGSRHHGGSARAGVAVPAQCGSGATRRATSCRRPVVRLYASTYPEDLFGLLLVDALTEGLQDAETPE